LLTFLSPLQQFSSTDPLLRDEDHKMTQSEPLPEPSLPSAAIIPFPMMPIDPAERLRRALATLEAALAEQRIAVANWRGAIADLNGSVSELGQSLHTLRDRLETIKAQTGA
jgi:uncharacterized coiled-coil protein SlyX